MLFLIWLHDQTCVQQRFSSVKALWLDGPRLIQCVSTGTCWKFKFISNLSDSSWVIPYVSHSIMSILQTQLLVVFKKCCRCRPCLLEHTALSVKWTISCVLVFPNVTNFINYLMFLLCHHTWCNLQSGLHSEWHFHAPLWVLLLVEGLYIRLIITCSMKSTNKSWIFIKWAKWENIGFP